MRNQKFYKLLRERGMTATLLAELSGTGRSHLSEVLNNKPGHGGHTRRKIFPWILPAEAEALGWLDEYMRWLRGPAKHLQACAAMRSEETSEDTGALARTSAGEGNTGTPAPIYST